MAVVEAIANQVSLTSALLVLLIAVIIYTVRSRLDERRRVLRLGNYGISISPPWVRLGLDIISRGINAARHHQGLELWRDYFFNRANTVEARIGGERTIFTIDPANIKAILATQFPDYGKGEPFHAEWKEFMGDGIFTTDGAKWHNSRQLLRPQFTRDRVSDLECFESHMHTFFRAMANGGALLGEDQPVDLARANGRVIEISDLFYRYTLDVATDFLLGADVKSMSTPRQAFADAFNQVQRWHAVSSRFGALRKYLPRTQYRANLRIIDDFVGHLIDLALSMTTEELDKRHKSDKGYTFLQEVVRSTRDRSVIRDQIVAVLLAGRDTTAGTLSWIIYELARHPACVAKLRQEILQTVGLGGEEARRPTYEHLRSMPYMKAVINEALRLYPSVPFNVRLALRDCTLPRGGGANGSEPMPVLKDQRVAYSTLVMQRRPDLYPPVSDTFADPGTFSPERWAHWHPKPHDYIPFNAGPRICIGQQFALMEMSYVLVRIFQRFSRLDSHMHELDGGEPTLRAEVTLSPGKGVHVAFWADEEKA